MNHAKPLRVTGLIIGSVRFFDGEIYPFYELGRALRQPS